MLNLKAETKFLKISPRKTRLVADLIRGMKAIEAQSVLRNLRRRSALPVLKTLKQAVANAVNNFKLKKDELVVKLIEVNSGPAYKRFQPVSRGRAHSIKKRTSHIKIILEVQNGPKS